MSDLHPVILIVVLICLIGLLLCSLLLFRNALVYQVKLKATKLIVTYARRSIMENHWADPKWRIFYILLEDYPTYDTMMWDIRKWKFSQFYPQIKERAERILEEGKRF